MVTTGPTQCRGFIPLDSSCLGTNGLQLNSSDGIVQEYKGYVTIVYANRWVLAYKDLHVPYARDIVVLGPVNVKFPSAQQWSDALANAKVVQTYYSERNHLPFH